MREFPETEKMSNAVTPSEWLLARYDSYGRGLQDLSFHPRYMFEEIDDHVSSECISRNESNCVHMSGYAVWPAPKFSDLVQATFRSSDEFRALVLADERLAKQNNE